MRGPVSTKGCANFSVSATYSHLEGWFVVHTCYSHSKECKYCPIEAWPQHMEKGFKRRHTYIVHSDVLRAMWHADRFERLSNCLMIWVRWSREFVIGGPSELRNMMINQSARAMKQKIHHPSLPNEGDCQILSNLASYEKGCCLSRSKS